MKQCIWCRKTENVITFNKRAHTFPDSLGGKNICKDVCDECNDYFGRRNRDSVGIEIVFKEALNLSKAILLKNTNNKYWFRSEFFIVDWKNRIISRKPKYTLHAGFQEKMGRQFRRGMFKVFLEERQCQCQDALDDRYNFIREFARYDIGDYPIFRHKPKLPLLLFSSPDVETPIMRFTEESEKIDAEYRLFGYLIMAHYFEIPTSRTFEWTLGNYLKKIKKENHPFGVELIPISRLEDVDFSFKFLHEKTND